MGRPFAQDLRRLKRRLADETGVTLVETIISAMILVVVVGAVFTTIDVGSRTAAANRARSVAATVAERDQERMRGLSALSLANYHYTRTEAVDGNNYTVTSDTEWVYDATGSTESCQNKNTQAEYLRISSTVESSLVGKRIAPVVMRSIVAPRVGSYGPGQGTLAVAVVDELNKPVKNMPVSISGPAGVVDTTNEFGCAIFSHVPVGDYTVSINQAGWVDPQRNQLSQKVETVSSGTTNSTLMTYALAAAIDVRFETKVGDDPIQVARGNGITVSNAKPGSIPFGPPPGPPMVPLITATSLFPFPDGYTAYAGTCESNDPTKYIPEYFATGSPYPGFTLVTPGATVPVTVREPSMNIHVRRRDNPVSPYEDLKNAHVVIKSVEPGCGTFEFTGLTKEGSLSEPGLPFGLYHVCVDDQNGKRVSTTTPIELTDPAGLPLRADGRPQVRFNLDGLLSENGECSTT